MSALSNAHLPEYVITRGSYARTRLVECWQHAKHHWLAVVAAVLMFAYHWVQDWLPVVDLGFLGSPDKWHKFSLSFALNIVFLSLIWILVEGGYTASQRKGAAARKQNHDEAIRAKVAAFVEIGERLLNNPNALMGSDERSDKADKWSQMTGDYLATPVEVSIAVRFSCPPQKPSDREYIFGAPRDEVLRGQLEVLKEILRELQKGEIKIPER